MPRLQIFRRADARELQATGMMAAAVMEPEPAAGIVDEIRDITGGGGYANRVLFGDADRDGMSLVWLWYAPHYALPRHSHDVDCTYYVVRGEAHLGNQVVHAGDGFFVPAGAPYAYAAGPDGVEVLEFRAVSSFGIRVTESATGWARLLATARTHGTDWATSSPPDPSR